MKLGYGCLRRDEGAEVAVGGGGGGGGGEHERYRKEYLIIY